MPAAASAGGQEPAPSAGQPVITMETAVREAVAWHPAVTEAVGRLNERDAEITVARAGYYPQIRAGLGSSYDNAVSSRWRPRTELSANQMIYDFGKVSSAVEAARAGTRIGRAQLLLAIDGLVRDTGFAVIEVQRGAALLDVARDQLASVQSISELVRHRFERGATTRSDALQAEARVEAAQATIAEITAAQRLWASNLAHLLGRSAGNVSPGSPDWLARACRAGEPDWDAVPAMMEAEAEREEALAQLKRSRAEGMPTVSLGGGYGADIQSPFSGRDAYNFGINLSSGIFQGGAVRARARAASHALGAAEAAMSSTRLEVSRRLAEGQEQVGSLNDLIATLASRREKMAETGKLYRLQYLDMGTRTLVDLLNAEQELHQIRFDAVNATHDLRRLEVDCLYSAGALRDSFGLSGQVVHGVTL